MRQGTNQETERFYGNKRWPVRWTGSLKGAILIPQNPKIFYAAGRSPTKTPKPVD